MVIGVCKHRDGVWGEMAAWIMGRGWVDVRSFCT